MSPICLVTEVTLDTSWCVPGDPLDRFLLRLADGTELYGMVDFVNDDEDHEIRLLDPAHYPQRVCEAISIYHERLSKALKEIADQHPEDLSFAEGANDLSKLEHIVAWFDDPIGYGGEYPLLVTITVGHIMARQNSFFTNTELVEYFSGIASIELLGDET